MGSPILVSWLCCKLPFSFLLHQFRSSCTQPYPFPKGTNWSYPNTILQKWLISAPKPPPRLPLHPHRKIKINEGGGLSPSHNFMDVAHNIFCRPSKFLPLTVRKKVSHLLILDAKTKSNFSLLSHLKSQNNAIFLYCPSSFLISCLLYT